MLVTQTTNSAKDNYTQAGSFAMILACTLSLLFITGIQPKIATVIAILIFFLIRTARFRAHFGCWTYFRPQTVLTAITITYVLIVAVVQFSFYLSGGQGVDFGIFSQLIDQVASKNRFWSSLIATEWHNFLTHHFSPYLIPLGIIAKIGIPAPYLLISVHVFAVGALAQGLYTLFFHFSRTVDPTVAFSSAAGLPHLLTLTTLLLPAARIGLMWETHDEVLALPFLVWSINAHFADYHRRKLMLLLPTLFFKETLALNIAALSVWYTIDTKEDRILPMMLGIISLVFFVLYTSILPGWLWTSTFKATERIGSIAHLTSWPIVIEKTLWAAKSFLPAVPFLFLHSRSSLRTAAFIALCASPNILAILVSKVPNMHQPFNYYSITPCVIIYIACAAPIINARLIIITTLRFACFLLPGRWQLSHN